MGNRPRPKITSIGGAAGTGKTTLLYEITERAARRGGTVVSAVASPAEQGLPYEVIEQLRQGLPGGGGARPRWLETTGPVPPHVLDELRREFTGPRAGHPVLITVDDAQFADQHSLQCLLHLVRHSPAGEVTVILTRGDRVGGQSSPLDELLADEDVHEVRLGPLTVEEVAGVLAGQLPAAEARRLAPTVHQDGGGNPLLTKALLADHLTHQAPGDTFRQAALRCIHRSGDAALAAARGLALLGSADGAPHVGALVGLDDGQARDAVAALGAAGILAGPHFRHEAVLAAVLDDLPAEECTRLRHRAAELLHHGGADPMSVADQLLGLDLADRPAGQEWVYRVLQEAANRALARDDVGYAMRCLQLAEHHCPNEAARLRVKFVLARLTWSMRPSAAPHQVRSLVEPAREGLIPPDHTLRLVTQLMWYGHLEDAVVVFRGISSWLNEDDDAPRLGAELQATRMLMAATYPGALDDTEQPQAAGPQGGPASGRAPDASRPTAFPELTGVPAPTYGPGSVSDAGKALQHTRLTDHSLETLRAALLTLVLHEQLGDADRACDRLLSQASSRHARPTPAVLTAMRGLISLRRGRLSEAAGLAESALQQLPARAWGVAIGLPLAVLAEARSHMGRYEAAAEALDQPVPNAMFRTRFALGFIYARGRFHLATGRNHAALADFLECGRLMAQWDLDSASLAPWRLGAAEAWLQLEQRERAVALLDEHLGRIRPSQGRTRGQALRVLASTAPATEAAELLEEAVELLHDSDDLYTLALATADLGRAHKRLGDRAKGRLLMRRAMLLADSCGAHELFQVLQPPAAGSAAGGTGRPRRPGPQAEGALTAAERRVAALAAHGHTNREIADKLFITVSTVEQHLTRVYRKTNITQRQDLSAGLHFDVAHSA
ncbi:AAA family ATPase [Kitasatospora sp. NPDC059648]|uniref:helix-turn-helix transcriptional regulator n=1 Tax=Kitasatospora sp. NPDC059648 TaxID=3346894 RepID=UPI0036AB8C77